MSREFLIHGRPSRIPYSNALHATDITATHDTSCMTRLPTAPLKPMGTSVNYERHRRFHDYWTVGLECCSSACRQAVLLSASRAPRGHSRRLSPARVQFVHVARTAALGGDAAVVNGREELRFDGVHGARVSAEEANVAEPRRAIAAAGILVAQVDLCRHGGLIILWFSAFYSTGLQLRAADRMRGRSSCRAAASRCCCTSRSRGSWPSATS